MVALRGCAALSLLTLVFSPSVFSADGDLPNAGSILRETEKTAPRLKAPATPGDLIETPEAARAVHDVPGLEIEVKAFRFSGASIVDEAALQAAVRPYLGARRDFQTLVDAAEAARRVAEKRGLLLAQAFIPPQELKDGVVEIRILEGRLGEVKIDWGDDILVNRSVVEGYLSSLRPNELLFTEELERALFLINDLAGVRATSLLKPGARPGTADLVVTVTPGPRTEGRLDLDDYGSRYSGMFRTSALLAVNSLTGLGDSLTMRAITSNHSGMNFGGLTYTLPVGNRGTRLGAGYSYLGYQLVPNTIDGLRRSGIAEVANIFAIHPFVRSRNLNLFAQLGLDHKKYLDRQEEDTTLGNRKWANVFNAALVGDFRDSLLGGGITAFNLSYARGEINRSNVSLDSPQGYFSKVLPSFSRLQAISGNEVALLVRYQGQYALGRLDSTEKFSLGGPAGVRAYAPGEAPGDEAHQLTAELRFRIDSQGQWPGDMVFTTFYDYGAARLDKDPSKDPTYGGTPNWRHLGGWGTGLNWASAGWSLQAALAFRDKGDPVNDIRDRAPRGYIQLTKYF